MIKVRTQRELEVALKNTNNGWDAEIWCVGGGYFALWGNSTATLWGNSTARAHDWTNIKSCSTAVILQHSNTVKITGGGNILQMTKPQTPAEWCDFHGVEVDDGVAILFKAVGTDYISSHGIAYAPGSAPVAPDWDGGKAECGCGLHFSPHPQMAESFHPNASHFLACPVKLDGIVVHPDGRYPNKVKAPEVCAPCWEVDCDGEKI